MLPAGKQALPCPKLAKGFCWIPLCNASLTFSFYIIDLGCDVLAQSSLPLPLLSLSFPVSPGPRVPGSPPEQLWT